MSAISGKDEDAKIGDAAARRMQNDFMNGGPGSDLADYTFMTQAGVLNTIEDQDEETLYIDSIESSATDGYGPADKARDDLIAKRAFMLTAKNDRDPEQYRLRMMANDRAYARDARQEKLYTHTSAAMPNRAYPKLPSGNEFSPELRKQIAETMRSYNPRDESIFWVNHAGTQMIEKSVNESVEHATTAVAMQKAPEELAHSGSKMINKVAHYPYHSKTLAKWNAAHLSSMRSQAAYKGSHTNDVRAAPENAVIREHAIPHPEHHQAMVKALNSGVNYDSYTRGVTAAFRKAGNMTGKAVRAAINTPFEVLGGTYNGLAHNPNHVSMHMYSPTGMNTFKEADFNAKLSNHLSEDFMAANADKLGKSIAADFESWGAMSDGKAVGGSIVGYEVPFKTEMGRAVMIGKMFVPKGGDVTLTSPYTGEEVKSQRNATCGSSLIICTRMTPEGPESDIFRARSSVIGTYDAKKNCCVGAQMSYEHVDADVNHTGVILVAHAPIEAQAPAAKATGKSSGAGVKKVGSPMAMYMLSDGDPLDAAN